MDTGGEKSDGLDSIKALTDYLDSFFERRRDLNKTFALLVITHPHIDLWFDNMPSQLPSAARSGNIFKGDRFSGWTATVADDDGEKAPPTPAETASGERTGQDCRQVRLCNPARR